MLKWQIKMNSPYFTWMNLYSLNFGLAKTEEVSHAGKGGGKEKMLTSNKLDGFNYSGDNILLEDLTGQVWDRSPF